MPNVTLESKPVLIPRALYLNAIRALEAEGWGMDKVVPKQGNSLAYGLRYTNNGRTFYLNAYTIDNLPV